MIRTGLTCILVAAASTAWSPAVSAHDRGARVVVGAPAVQIGVGAGRWHGGHRHRGWGWGIGLAFPIVPAYAYPYAYPQPYPPAGWQPVPPAAEPVPVAPRVPDPIFYPAKGQTPEQAEADRQACNRWATTQPQALADAGVFHRATLACMEGRGYAVR